MKILHFCGSSTGAGGAGIACERINAALVKAGIDSRIWGKGLTNIQRSASSARQKLWLSLFHPAYNHSTTLGLRSRSGLVQLLNDSDCDVLHLHIPNNAIAIQDIPRLRKKIVWTLHDSWTFCGTEIHPVDNRYIEGYRWNNQTLKRWFDIDLLIWLWKKHCWKDLDAAFTAPSAWEAEQFRRSKLFFNRPCQVIPHCLDRTVFHRREQGAARRELGLPDAAKIVLFGASAIGRPLKGLDLLLEALHKMTDPGDLRLVCFGNVADPSIFAGLKIPVHCTGPIFEPEKLAVLYSAADVFVCPSRMESFSNTSLEALSCGTPVTAFNVGGVRDVVAHARNGYLAAPYDTSDLAEGIRCCLELPREKIEFAPDRFSEAEVARQYLELYEKVLEQPQKEAAI